MEENDFDVESFTQVVENVSEEPTNVNGINNQNAKDLVVDRHFYKNFGDLFYEDALKDIMTETIEAAQALKIEGEEEAQSSK